MIEFSKFLATIKIDVPITLNMDELKREEPNEEELRKIFQEMESRTPSTAFSTETRNPPSPEHTPMRPETICKDETYTGRKLLQEHAERFGTTLPFR